MGLEGVIDDDDDDDDDDSSAASEVDEVGNDAVVVVEGVGG